jgi:peptide-methionine (S)-S-oxide reductase
MPHQLEEIVFGGGCFWCIEAIFQMVDGVDSVISGYAGGTTENPNYYQVSEGVGQHAEVVQVRYDPQYITLENLYAIFFTAHDPTTRNRQGADIGIQYRSVIYYTTREQKNGAEKYVARLTDEKIFADPIITEIMPLIKFFPAEAYHQNYYAQNKDYNPY